MLFTCVGTAVVRVVMMVVVVTIMVGKGWKRSKDPLDWLEWESSKEWCCEWRK